MTHAESPPWPQTVGMIEDADSSASECVDDHLRPGFSQNSPEHVLVTERLRLRPPAQGDIDFVHDLYSRREVVQYIGRGEPDTSPDQAAVRVERYRKQFRNGLGVWIVESRQDATPVGFVLMKPIQFSDDIETDGQDIEIGWHFHPDVWGSGFATEATRELINYARTSRLQRLVAVTHAQNVASQAVAKRLGMTHEGSTDRYYNTACELFTLELWAHTRIRMEL